LRRDMDRMFDRMWGEFGLPSAPPMVKGVPFIDLTETDKHLILRAEVPGMDAKDFEIVIVDNTLTIKGETRQEISKEGANYHKTERRYGSFSRTLQLPCKILIDDVKATYKKGILKIVMPKCAPEPTKTVRVLLK
jgi:HSP20 family protein